MRFKNLPEYNEVFRDEPVTVYAVETIGPEIEWKNEWGEPRDCLLGHSDKNMLGDIVINTKSGEVYLFTTDQGEWSVSRFPSLQATLNEIRTLKSMLPKTKKNIYKNDMYAYELLDTFKSEDIKSADLRELAKESENWVYATAQAFKDHEPLEVLYMPAEKQAGIAQKSQTTWTKADSLENAIDRYTGCKNQALEKLYRRKFRKMA